MAILNIVFNKHNCSSLGVTTALYPGKENSTPEPKYLV